MTITPAPTALGVTVSDWVDQLHREYLDRRDRVELDQLDGAVTTTATSITVRHGSLRPQVQVEVGNELVHVWGPDAIDQAYSVLRAQGGSTAVQHADAALVRVGPRYPRIVLAKQLQREIRSWPTSIYAIASGELAAAAKAETVDLDGLGSYEVIRVCRVQRDHPTASDTSWPVIGASLERNQTNDFASGYALRLHHPPESATTLRVAVGYRHPVPALNFSDDLGTAYHLNAALADAAMLGVAGRLLMADEVDRTDDRSQPRPRRAEDVPPGHRLQTGQSLIVLRDQMLKAEAERLLSQYTMGY